MDLQQADLESACCNARGLSSLFLSCCLGSFSVLANSLSFLASLFFFSLFLSGSFHSPLNDSFCTPKFFESLIPNFLTALFIRTTSSCQLIGTFQSISHHFFLEQPLTKQPLNWCKPSISLSDMLSVSCVWRFSVSLHPSSLQPRNSRETVEPIFIPSSFEPRSPRQISWYCSPLHTKIPKTKLHSQTVHWSQTALNLQVHAVPDLQNTFLHPKPSKQHAFNTLYSNPGSSQGLRASSLFCRYFSIISSQPSSQTPWSQSSPNLSTHLHAKFVWTFTFIDSRTSWFS